MVSGELWGPGKVVPGACPSASAETSEVFSHFVFRASPLFGGGVHPQGVSFVNISECISLISTYYFLT